MFTGLVEEIGTVKAVQRGSDSFIKIKAELIFFGYSLR